jgi:hypothetical protein
MYEPWIELSIFFFTMAIMITIFGIYRSRNEENLLNEFKIDDIIYYSSMISFILGIWFIISHYFL